jgi:hypothetical protein
VTDQEQEQALRNGAIQPTDETLSQTTLPPQLHDCSSNLQHWKVSQASRIISHSQGRRDLRQIPSRMNVPRIENPRAHDMQILRRHFLYKEVPRSEGGTKH